MSDERRRARRLLARPGGWVEAAAGGGYALRVGADPRSRVLMTVNEADFLGLVADIMDRLGPYLHSVRTVVQIDDLL